MEDAVQAELISQAFSQRAFTAPDIVLDPEYRYNAYICNEKSHFRHELPEMEPEDVSISKFVYLHIPCFSGCFGGCLVPVLVAILVAVLVTVLVAVLVAV